MTEKQIQLVQQSWKHIKPVAQQAGLIFYEKLFLEAPQIRHLFKDDIASQADKLVVMLGYVVTRLDRINELTAEIEELGKRHQQYGAKPAHYDLVGNTLVATLKAGLAEKWNDDLQEAWVTAFNIIKSAMLKHYCDTASISVPDPK